MISKSDKQKLIDAVKNTEALEIIEKLEVKQDDYYGHDELIAVGINDIRLRHFKEFGSKNNVICYRDGKFSKETSDTMVWLHHKKIQIFERYEGGVPELPEDAKGWHIKYKDESCNSWLKLVESQIHWDDVIAWAIWK